MTGSKVQAESGTLAFLVGGPVLHLDRLARVEVQPDEPQRRRDGGDPARVNPGARLDLDQQQAQIGRLLHRCEERVGILDECAHNVDKVLTRMGPGEFFGEMNLFGGLQRSATVQAEADTELLVLDRDTLTAVVGQNPPAGLAFFSALVREFSQRLSATDDLVTEVTRWGLEASGIELSDEPRAPLDPSLDPKSGS